VRDIQFRDGQFRDLLMSKKLVKKRYMKPFFIILGKHYKKNNSKHMAQGLANNEVRIRLPSVSQSLLRKMKERAQKIYDLFNEIGVNKIKEYMKQQQENKIVEQIKGQAIAFRSNILVYGNLSVVAGICHSVVFFIHATSIKQNRKFDTLFSNSDSDIDTDISINVKNKKTRVSKNHAMQDRKLFKSSKLGS
ncbi:22784_t:CDS:2, partial [Gigaspora margarita]